MHVLVTMRRREGGGVGECWDTGEEKKSKGREKQNEEGETGEKKRMKVVERKKEERSAVVADRYYTRPEGKEGRNLGAP